MTPVLPPDPSPFSLHPDLQRIVDGARADVGDAARLHAIATRLGPQLSAVPAAGAAAWLPHALVGAVVAGAITAGAVTMVSHSARAPVARATSSALIAAPVVPAPPPPTVNTAPWVPSASPVETPEVLAPSAPPPAQKVQSARSSGPLASKSPAVEAPEPATTGVPAGVQAYEPPEVAPSRPQTRVSAPVDPTVQEHEILAEARRSLDTNPRDTLTRVADHERRFPSGDLSSDRELLRIRALMRLGRLSEARDARDRFLTRWPASAYRDEINQLVSP